MGLIIFSRDEEGGVERQIAHYLSIVYVAVMVLNGIGHHVATIVTGRYFGGFAGGFSGIGLILFGVPLSYFLIKNRPARMRRS
jgi:hypothetical protein